ncbi:MAG TPA: hypothetical protein VHF07_00365 [Nitrospiraceae bacterium]|nr:hypothetical protein [Nitrospiraceae bacterium]
MDSRDTDSSSNVLDLMQAEFRQSLQLFYSRLQLAPPYDSVEKALRRLTTSVKGLSAAEQQRLLSDRGLRWAAYRQAFADSGLSRKHRGIISGLARQRSTLGLPPEFDDFFQLYTGGE